jgi:hypothetical protein
MTPSISEESSGIGSGSGNNQTAPAATVASLYPSESVRSTGDTTETTTKGRRKSHSPTNAVGSKSNSKSNTTRQDELIVVCSEDEDEDDPVSIVTRTFQGSISCPLESKPFRPPLATALDPLVLTSSDEHEDSDEDGLVQSANAETAASSRNLKNNKTGVNTKRPETVFSSVFLSQQRGTKRSHSSAISIGQDIAKVKQEDRSSRMDLLSFSDSESDDDDDDLLFGIVSALGKVRKTLPMLPITTAKPLGKVRKTLPKLSITEAKPALDESQRDCINHLEEITKVYDRALQLLLWEIGFGYNIYAHQFEATRFVAGLVPTFPVPSNAEHKKVFAEVAASMSEQSINGANHRSEALKMAALEFSSRLNNNIIHTNDDSRFTLPTKGMLLADEMGLGTHACFCFCLQFLFVLFLVAVFGAYGFDSRAFGLCVSTETRATHSLNSLH